MRCSELTHLKTGSLPLWPAFSHSPLPCSLWQTPFCLFPRAKQGSFSSETKPLKGGMAECSWCWGSHWESTAKPGSGKAPPAAPTPGRGTTQASTSLGSRSAQTSHQACQFRVSKAALKTARKSHLWYTCDIKRKCTRCRAEPQAETPGGVVISSLPGGGVREPSQAPLGADS